MGKTRQCRFDGTNLEAKKLLVVKCSEGVHYPGDCAALQLDLPLDCIYCNGLRETLKCDLAYVGKGNGFFMT